jgi:hypothetical protein
VVIYDNQNPSILKRNELNTLSHIIIVGVCNLLVFYFELTFSLPAFLIFIFHILFLIIFWFWIRNFLFFIF